MAARRLCRDYLSPLFPCCSRSIWLPFSSSEYLHKHCFFSKHRFSTATEQTGTCNTVPHGYRNRWRKTEISGMICAHFGKGSVKHLSWVPPWQGTSSVWATCNWSCRCKEKACLWQMIWGMGMMVAIDGFFMRSHALSVWKPHRNRNCSCTDRGPIRNYFWGKRKQLVYVLRESFLLVAKSPA